VILVYDMESDGFYHEATTIWCICAMDIYTKKMYSFVHPESFDKTSEGLLFLGQAEEIIAHNQIDFDLEVFRKLYNWEYKGKITDTVVLSRMLNPDRRAVKGVGKSGPHSVAAWGQRLGRYKPDHTDWTQFSSEMLHRCWEDTAIGFLVYEELMREASGWDWSRASWVEHEFARIVSAQAKRGWLFNMSAALVLLEWLDARMGELHLAILPILPLLAYPSGELKRPLLKSGAWTASVQKHMEGCTYINDDWIQFKHGGQIYNSKFGIWGPFCRIDLRRPDLGSSTQCKSWLLSIGWVPTEWNRSKKTRQNTSPKLTEDSYESLGGDTGKIIREWLQARHRHSLITGLIRNVRGDGRISTPSISLGTPTGRQTHSIVVNIPGETAYLGQQIRELFLATPGYLIVGGDSASCQARLLCHYMGNKEFTNAVITGNKELGTDLHTLNVALTGCPNRRIAKNFFYGYIFGAKAKTAAATCGVSVKEMQGYMDNYAKRLPELQTLIKVLEAQFNKHGYLIASDGRKLYPRNKKDVLVTLLQGDEAISMKLAAVYVEEWARKEGIEYHQLIHVHDEIQSEVLPKDLERVDRLLSYAIVQAGVEMNLSIPLGSEIKSGDTWWSTH